MATIGWFTDISTPTGREAVKVIATAVTAMLMFELEVRIFLRRTTYERYIAF